MNLLPYAGLICRIAMQTLKWTRVDKWAYGTDRPFRYCDPVDLGSDLELNIIFFIYEV